MKTQTNKGERKQPKIAVAITSILLLGVLAFGFFYSASWNYLRSICNTELEDYAANNAFAVKSDLENALQLTQTASERFSDMDDYTSPAAQRALQIIAHNASFERMVLCTANGTGISSAGGTMDFSDCSSFQRSLYGESSIASLDVDRDGELEILVSAPIISNGQVKGVLCGIYQIFDLTRLINVTSFDGRGYAVLVDLDGNIIVPDTSPYGLNKKDENYWTFYERAAFGRGYSYEALMADIQQRKSGISKYAFGSEERELYYMPIGLNDWYLLQMVPADVIANYTEPMTKMVLGLIAQIVVLALLIGLIVHRHLERSRRAQMLEAERFRVLAENVPAGVAELEVGEHCQLEFANEGFFQIMGYSREEFMEPPIQGCIFRILAAEKREEILRRLQEQIRQSGRVSLEYEIRQKSGEIRWVSLTGKVMRESQGLYFLQTIITDVTVQKRATAEIIETAKLDKMTNLYNKVNMTDLVTRELLQVQPNSMDVLLVLDIDNFKHVNDTYGHQVGDGTIIQVARTIDKTFRNSDLKGRIGGDEFMVLMRGVNNIVHAETRANQFLKALSELELDDSCVRVTCSVGGVAVQKQEPYAFDAVFHQADQNLYQVKKNGKGMVYIQPFQAITSGEEGSMDHEDL